MTSVVHCKREKYDVYIGRRYDTTCHYGNPFKVGEDCSRGECVEMFEDWLLGLKYQDVEPDRRLWILAHIENLRDKVLGCWCKINGDESCHGDVYVKLLHGDIIFLCHWCDKAFANSHGKFCPHCCRFQP